MRTARFLSILSILCVTAALVLWVGCADNTLFTDLPEDRVVSANSEQLAATDRVRHRVDDDLLNREGIEGVGTRILADGSTSIVVYTRSENAAAKADIPVAIEGLPVTTVVTGVFRARSEQTSKARPAPIGFSVGHPDITAGTLGARVVDGQGNVYILSNNHVLANSNNANVGDATLQPGPYDGGTSADQIGTLHDFEPLDFSNDNTMDAAITAVSVSDVDYKTPSEEGYGSPGTTVVTASVGQDVQKYGRTTGHTHGQVAEINVTVNVCYQCAGPFCFSCSKSARFVNQIGISPGGFSAGGDSGSLIVTDDGNNNPVGLLFAGSDTRTLANPIGPVLNRFNVIMDDGSGSDGGDGGTTNTPPSASFTYTTSELTAVFTDKSSDNDGSVVGWTWDFGDGGSSTAQNPSHTYSSGGTYAVTLTVTDNEGATNSTSQDVTVSSSSTSNISLSASGYKVRGLQKADLSWSGANSSSVDVYRDGSKISDTNNDGEFTDNIDNRGSGSYIYQICEAGTSTCSNEATVTI